MIVDLGLTRDSVLCAAILLRVKILGSSSDENIHLLPRSSGFSAGLNWAKSCRWETNKKNMKDLFLAAVGDGLR